MVKKIVAGLVLLLLLILTGVFLLFKTKGDVLIEKFSAYVEETTGEPLSVEGTPGLTFLPSPGLKLGRATWGRPDGPIYVSFGSASVTISTSALLTGNIRITGLNVDELDVAIRIQDIPHTSQNIVPDTDGLTQSSALLRPVTSSPRTETAPSSQTPVTALSADIQRHMLRILDILPDNLEVTKGRFCITQTNGSAITLNNLALKLNNKRSDHTVSAIVSALSEYAASSVAAPLWGGFPPNVSGQLHLNFSTSLKDSQLALELTNASLQPVTGFPFSKVISIRGMGEYALNTGALRVQTLDMELPGLTASAQATVKSVPVMLADAMHSGDATMELKVSGSPRELLTAIGTNLTTSNPHALNNVNFTASATLHEGALSIRKLDGMLDKTPVRGTLQVGLTRPGLSGDLVIGDLDLDAFLAPPQPSTDTEPATIKSSSAAPIKRNAEPQHKSSRTITALAWPELNLNMRINSLKIKGLTLSEIHARSEGTKGNYTINPLSLRMFGSPITASLKATVLPDAFPPTPDSHVLLSANISAAGINLEEAGRYFLQKESISGQGSLNATLSCDSNAPVRTLAGKGSLSAEPLHIKADLLPPNAGVTPQSPTTGKFDKALLTFVADHGIVTIQSASLSSPRLALTGTGSLNLPAQTLDLAGALQITGLAVLPVRLVGPLTSPRYSLNAKTTLDAVSKTLQEHGVDVQKEIQRGIKALFR